jgi:Ni/Fe-hydrogenase subunit HybB-like protein
MSILPDWLLLCMTGAALCALVLGWGRTAALLATPALVRFILWPLAWHYLSTVPVALLVAIGLIAIPFLLLRGLHKLLRLASSQEAADHAMGDFLGRGLLGVARRFGRRR